MLLFLNKGSKVNSPLKRAISVRHGGQASLL